MDLDELKRGSRRTRSFEEQSDKLQSKINKVIEDWYTPLADLLPGGALEARNRGQNRKYPLCFPSDFSSDERLEFGLEDLAWTERELRIGLAFDALTQLRKYLGLKSFLVQKGHKWSKGSKEDQDTEASVSRSEKHCKRWKHIYRRNYACLERLREGCGDRRCPADLLGRLQELKNEHCVMLSSWLEEHRDRLAVGEVQTAKNEEKGAPRLEVPWIWKLEFVGFQANPADNGHFEGDLNGDLSAKLDQWTEEGDFLACLK